ncbi:MULTISPECIES: MFS transporter [unclassified Anaeromyxobacter]|uniref:MFS transporter n=1 Tax=unclassified Anaeromyxobacter TaxID=2620896 RepID=UPI001F59A7AF|nr:MULTISPECIES: MFS transporter [unclassified Anaeromyxobacter]
MVPAARLRLFYFLYYGTVGTNLPYFAAYLRGLGYTGEQIGTVQMLPSLAAPAVAISWASWADRRGSPARALRRAALVAVSAAVLLPLVRSPLAVGAVLLVQALGERAVVPLVDSVSLEWTRARPGTSYTGLRLFGSLGFVALALGVGRALALRGDRPGDVLVPALVACGVAGYALVARTVPAAPPHPGARPGLADLGQLVRDRRLLLFLAACALHWAACAPYHLLFGVLVRDRGLPSDVTGLGMAAGVVAEIAALLVFPRLERRHSLRRLLAVAFLGSAVRWALVSRAESAGAIVALQLLHGLSFGLFWGAAMDAMAELVPPRLRASGQALFSAIVFGAGNAFGYQLAGAGYDRYGSAAPLFVWAAALEIAALAFALLFLGRRAAAPAAGPARPV